MFFILAMFRHISVNKQFNTHTHRAFLCKFLIFPRKPKIIFQGTLDKTRQFTPGSSEADIRHKVSGGRRALGRGWGRHLASPSLQMSSYLQPPGLQISQETRELVPPLHALMSLMALTSGWCLLSRVMRSGQAEVVWGSEDQLRSPEGGQGRGLPLRSEAGED